MQPVYARESCPSRQSTPVADEAADEPRDLLDWHHARSEALSSGKIAPLMPLLTSPFAALRQEPWQMTPAIPRLSTCDDIRQPHEHPANVQAAVTQRAETNRKINTSVLLLARDGLFTNDCTSYEAYLAELKNDIANGRDVERARAAVDIMKKTSDQSKTFYNQIVNSVIHCVVTYAPMTGNATQDRVNRHDLRASLLNTLCHIAEDERAAGSANMRDVALQLLTILQGYYPQVEPSYDGRPGP